jgi:hypothetical protein
LAQHFSRFNPLALDSIVQMDGIARAPVAVLVLGTAELLVAQVLEAIRIKHQHLRIKHQHLRIKHQHLRIKHHLRFIQAHQRANQVSQDFVRYWIGIKGAANLNSVVEISFKGWLFL